MKVLRGVVAIVAGYVVFALASMLLVGRVMAGEGWLIIALGLIGLAGVGLASGALGAVIAGANGRWVGFVLAGLVALATVANLAMQLGAEPTWYKVGTLVLTAPLILLICLRRVR